MNTFEEIPLRGRHPGGAVISRDALRKTHTGIIATALLLAASVTSAATFTVTNNADSGPGSLRTAISSAGAPGADTVAFAIVGSTDITLTSDIVSSFVNGVTIDGSTQPGIKIILDIPTSGSRGISFLASTDIVIQDLEISRINSISTDFSIYMALAPFNATRPERIVIRRVTVGGSSNQIGIGSAIDAEVSDCVINDGRALSLAGTLTGVHAFGNHLNVDTGLFIQAGGALTVTSSIPVGPSNYVVFEPGNGIETTTTAISSFANNSVTVRDIDLSYAGPLPGRVGSGILGAGFNWVVDNVRVTNRVTGVSLAGHHNGQVTNSDLSNNDTALFYQEANPPGVNLTVSGNVFTGSTIGVKLESVSNVLITNAVPGGSTNYIVFDAASDIATVGSPLVSSNSSLHVENIDFSGAPGVGGTAISYNGNRGGTITGCTISDRTTGVFIRNDQGTNTLSCNRIERNSGHGFASQDGNSLGFSTILVDNYISGNAVGVLGGNNGPGRTVALNNYWGAADGPSTLGGSGDSYFGTVDADPFSTTPASCFNDVPVAVCQDFVVSANGVCVATVDVADIDDNSFDPDGPADIATICITAVDGNAVGCVASVDFTDDLGTHTVTLTITDLAGENASCGGIVTVVDDTAPTVTAGTIASCYPTVAAAETAALAATTISDNCSGNITPSVATSGTCSATVTVTAIDASGNEASVAYATSIDATAPIVTAGTIAPCYPTVAAAEVAAIAATTAVDDCLGLVTMMATTSGTCSATVTVTATDSCGSSASVDYSTIVDGEPPDVAIHLVPVTPLPPAVPGSVCSAPASRVVQIDCAVSDYCDLLPIVSATLSVTNHDVIPGPACADRVEEVTVACGELIELRLVAPPCPAKPPRSPRVAVEVNSAGIKVVTGEAIIATLAVTDQCQNTATASVDPTDVPSPICDEVLVDGTCCPAIGRPEDPSCHLPLCGQ